MFKWELDQPLFPHFFPEIQVLLRALELGLSRSLGPSRCGVAETWAAAEELLRGKRLGQAVQAAPEQRGWNKRLEDVHKNITL